jgi:hypothetical protein
MFTSHPAVYERFEVEDVVVDERRMVAVALLKAALLTRIIHEASTAAADPGMFTALRFFGLLDVLSSKPPAPSVARLVPAPVCAASLRTFMNNAG